MPERRRPDGRFVGSKAAGFARLETKALPECARRTDARADDVVRKVHEPRAAADWGPAGDSLEKMQRLETVAWRQLAATALSTIGLRVLEVET